MKHSVIIGIVLLLVLCVFSVSLFAAGNVGFIYQGNEDGTITITGLSGELTEGQDLVIPASIDGKTVTAITGSIGNADPWDETAKYGSLTLPDTIKSLINFSCNGFTGTLTIPSSVTTLTDCSAYNVEKLIVDASVSTLSGFSYFSDLKELRIGEGIEYINGGFNNCDKLESVYLPDSLKEVNWNSFMMSMVGDVCPATFYLKRFECVLDEGTEFEWRTKERANQIGLSRLKYCYTNTNEELPLEGFWVETSGMERTQSYGFDGSSWKQWYTLSANSSNPTIKVSPRPINTTSNVNLSWDYDNANILSIDEAGAITILGSGTVKATGTIGDKTCEIEFIVNGFDDVFKYSINEDGTITITGLSGELTEGQDLAVPATIDGKTVTAITGSIGNADPWEETAKYGSLTLPDTIKSLINFSCNGFTGTLTIPSSVTTLTDCSAYNVEKLIVDASVSTLSGFSYFSDLKELRIGEGIEYINGGFNNCDKLESVYLPDSLKEVNWNSFMMSMVGDVCPATFYLKRFECVLDEGTEFEWRTKERANQIGLSRLKYCYTNTNEELPLEGFWVETSGMERTQSYGFDGSSWKQWYTLSANSSNPTIKVSPRPINTTSNVNLSWDYDNANILSIDEAGAITILGSGTVKATGTIGDKTCEIEFIVNGFDDVFKYSINEDGTITITGLSGELTEGQDLAVPATIDGKTVTAITGSIGNADPWEETAKYGSLTLPDTIKSLINFSCNGFTGTLTIPSSVTTFTCESASNINKLIVNASVSMLTGFNYCPELEEIMIGEGIEYIGGGFRDCGKLKSVYLPDSLKEVHWSSFRMSMENAPCPATIFLKRFECVMDEGTEYEWRTKERASWIGIGDLKYCYTNTDEELPLEGFLIEKNGFSRFSVLEYTNSYGQSFYTYYDGLYKGWNGSYKIVELPINTTDHTDIQWSSSNTNVVTVHNGIVNAIGVGTSRVTAEKGGKKITKDILVRGISIIPTSNDVTVNEIEGNVDIEDVALNEDNVSIEVIAEAVDANEWLDKDTYISAFSKTIEDAISINAAYDIHLQIKAGEYSQTIQPIEGKSLTVEIPVSKSDGESILHLFHIKDNGAWEELSFYYEKKQGKDYAVFQTTEFSKFVLVGPDNNPQIVETKFTSVSHDKKTLKVTLEYDRSKTPSIICVALYGNDGRLLETSVIDVVDYSSQINFEFQIVDQKDVCKLKAFLLNNDYSPVDSTAELNIHLE